MTHNDGIICLCCSEHRPSVLHVIDHHIIPKYCGGRDVVENIRDICDTTHRNVHLIFDPMWLAKKVLPRNLGEPWYSYNLAKQGIEWWHDRPDLRF